MSPEDEKMFEANRRANALRVQRALPQKAPKQSFFNKIRDQFDANTQADQYRRQQAGQARMFGDQLKAEKTNAGSHWFNAVKDSTIGHYQSLGEGLSTAFGEGNNLRNYEAKTQQENLNHVENLRKQLEAPNTSLADRAALRSRLRIASNASQASYNRLIQQNKDLQEKADPRRQAGNIAQIGADLAGLGVAGFAGKEFGVDVAKLGFKEAARRAAPAVGQNLVLNTAQGAAGEIQSGKPSIKGAIEKGIIGGAVGTVADLTVGGFSGLVSNKAYKNVVKELAGETDGAVVRETVQQIANDLPEDTVNKISQEITDATDEATVDSIIKQAAQEEAGIAATKAVPAVTTPTTPTVSDGLVAGFKAAKTPQQARDSVKVLFPELEDKTVNKLAQDLANATDDNSVAKILQDAQASRKAVTEGIDNAAPTGEIAPTPEQQLADQTQIQPTAPITSNQAPSVDIQDNQVIAQNVDETGKPVNAVQDAVTPLADGERYTTTNADIAFGSDSNGGVVSYKPDGAGTQVKQVSYNQLSEKTRTELITAEQNYAKARANSKGPVKPGTRGEVQIAREQLDIAKSNAIEELGLQDYANKVDSSGNVIQKTYNDRYTDWAEAKYKSLNPDEREILAKDAIANPEKYKAQFEAESRSTNQAITPEAQATADIVVPETVTNAETLSGQFQKQFVDKDANYINYLKQVEKDTGQTGLVDQFYLDSGRQRRANSIANAQIGNSENLSQAFSGLTGDAKAQFDEYVSLRNEIANAKRGLKTAEKLPVLQAREAQLASQYGERFASLNNFYKEWATRLHENGIITDEMYQSFVKNDDYTHIKRVMDDLAGYTGGSGNSYSLGSTKARLKRTGSERATQPADITALNYAQQMQSEIERNKTATDIIDVLVSQGHAKALVNADDVQFRKEMYKFLSDTKEGKTMVDRLAKKYGKQVRALQSEVDRLNKEGMNISLGIDRTKKGKTNAFRYKTDENLVNPTAIGTRTQRSIGAAREVSGTVINQQAIEGGVKASDVRQYMKDILRQDPQELKRIKNKLSTREPRLKSLIEEAERLKNESEAFGTARKQAYQAAMARADLNTTNKNLLKRKVKGITEVYQVPRDIKEIADNITPFQLGTLGKIIAAPQRTLRAGATGLSAPFTIANYVKDQASVAVLSKDLVATSLNPKNAAEGLFRAAQETLGGDVDNALWKKFIETGGDTTGYDVLRNVKNAKQASREIRLGKKGKYANMAGSPIRTLEDLNSITERATRFQSFKGVYDKVLKETGNEVEATRQATLASWQNSVDFSRMGNTAQAINLLIPYFNAGIQGTRLLGRRLADNPAATATKALGFLAMPVLGATLYNMDDPERRAVYENISPYERENNIIVVLPGAKQGPDGTYDNIIKVPIQKDLIALAQPFRMQAENFAGTSSQNEISQMSQQFFGAFSGPINTNSIRGALGSLTPQVVKPAIQQVANQDLFTGKQVVPDYVNNATDAQGNPVAEKDKAYKFTSGTANIIGGKLGVSPIRVEKFIKDTTSKVGLYGLNASDNVLAKLGVIKPDQIGGISVKDDIARRFVKAQGDYNYQKSAGGKYYDSVKAATKGLTGNEKAAFDSLHPSKTNFRGEDIFDENKRLTKYARAGLYLQFPKVFAADKAINDSQVKLGNPSNPLYDLPKDQLTRVLLKATLPPGAKDPELSNLYQQEWYQDYKNKQSKYYDSLKAKLESQGKTMPKSDNPYPTTPPELQKTMDYYSSLPKGTGARSSWIKANSGLFDQMKQQWGAVDAWENKERVALGLSPIDNTTNSSSSGGKFGYSKGGSKKEKSQKTYINTLLGDVPKISSNEISIKTAPKRAKLKVKTPGGKGRNYKKIKLS